MASSFTIYAISLIFALSLHLPNADQAQLQQISSKDPVTAYSYAQKSCLGLMRTVFGQDISLEEIQTTIAPIVQQMESSSQSQLGRQFLGKFEYSDVIQSFQKICLKPVNIEQDLDFRNQVVEAVTYFKKLESELPPVDSLTHTRQENSVEVSARSQILLNPVSIDGPHIQFLVQPNEVPEKMVQAFISAEDKRFFEHTGVDIDGIFKAIMYNAQSSSQLYGASTITQQLIKNTLLTYDRTLDRKIREVLLAYRATQQLSKQDILVAYLNNIYFGRKSLGIKAAALNYLGKPLSELSIGEMAFLAGLPKNPNNYDPEKNYDTILKRRNRILREMNENGFISAEVYSQELSEPIDYVSSNASPINSMNNYFMDEIRKELSAKSIDFNPTENYKVETTLNVGFQIAMTEALQKGLIDFEKNYTDEYAAWVPDQIIQTNIADKLKGEQNAPSGSSSSEEVNNILAKRNSSRALLMRRPVPQDSVEKKEITELEEPSAYWIKALAKVPNLYPDTSWKMAVVLSTEQEQVQLGLVSKEQVTLSSEEKGIQWQGQLKIGDVVYVEKQMHVPGQVYYLRRAPNIQGAAVILDTSTGGILSLVGGFSHKHSSWNRAVMAYRQPGSTIKPFIYLAALNKGIPPNYLVYDGPLQFDPIGVGGHNWKLDPGPNTSFSWLTLRSGLENSNNHMSAFLLNVIGPTPLHSLDEVRKLTEDFGVYKAADRDTLSFIIGAQETSLLNLTAAYAAIANDGFRVQPHYVTRIHTNKRIIQSATPPAIRIKSSDPDSLFQLKSFLKGVSLRGTAWRLGHFASKVSGKTGTTNDNRDAWYVGFTSRYAIGVWVGYDNKDAQSVKTLGRYGTGGRVAVPIVKNFLESFAYTIDQEGVVESPEIPPHDLMPVYFNHKDLIYSSEPSKGFIREYFKPKEEWQNQFYDSLSTWTATPIFSIDFFEQNKVELLNNAPLKRDEIDLPEAEDPEREFDINDIF